MMDGSTAKNGKINQLMKKCKLYFIFFLENFEKKKIKFLNKISKEGGDKNAIKITPTGWANIKEIICMRENEYIVPYSSHSNYNEMEKFVCSISPSVLKCVVREKKSNYRKIGGNSTGLGSG